VRAVVEAAGIRDILTKSLGSANTLNIVKATMKALDEMKSPEEIAAMRGKPESEIAPFWERRKNG
jgi:small subunit ribosomal protein S5